MSWISDVKYELDKLKVNNQILKKFGLLIGIVFLSLSIWWLIQQVFITVGILFFICGSILFIGGLLFPSKLKTVYKLWMGLAFVLGWIVSRFLLTVLFLFVLTPIGILAKVFKKDFLQLNYKKNIDSFWIRKEEKNINYEKMF